MRKTLLILSIVFSVLNADGLYKEYKTDIIGINGNTATIKDSNEIVIGSSGIVVHHFDATTSSIIASVEVRKKSAGTASLKLTPYQGLKQDALPQSGVKPSAGDRVILNYLYDRALVVAPSYPVYNKIVNTYKNITWVNPDIPASYLAKMYKPNPDKKVFQTMCSQNVASLILFALDSGTYFVDCHDFKIVKKDKAIATKSYQLPFYSRVTSIEAGWFDFGATAIDNYEKYYQALIRP
ncbi:plasminogen-binding N-terminal domain-containing protein [Sulfurospirillum sp. 1612]|uniref:plasminogen-binding N-terminal domain-containing protein n=1 Tax=Sulfurospirillum sp. 1612 TaxID=3094835 RepID=UPI002F95E9E3